MAIKVKINLYWYRTCLSSFYFFRSLLDGVMNIMRKFLGGAGNGGQPPDSGGGGSSGAEPSCRPEQELLGLNHLRKLYNEYSQPNHPLSTPEREARLYAMLPLFCKIFNSVPAKMIAERFPDTSSFAQACSKLLVTEVSLAPVEFICH
jgi:hypothetical protein